MKWYAKQLYDTRKKRRFLFFPRCVAGEWRWLVRATWEEKVYTGCLIGTLAWYPEQWLD